MIPVDILDLELSPEIMGKALREKIFNLDIQGRKTKKELIQKYELAQKQRAEAIEKGQIPLDNPIDPIDTSKPDRIYLISGYPKNQEEAEALGNNGHCIHIYMYILPEKNELKAIHDKIIEDYQLKSNQNNEYNPPIQPGIPET